MMFAAYGEATETTPWMMATIGFLVLFPMSCVTTVVGGWRLFIAERYPLAWKVALIPVPIMVVIGVLLAVGWE